MEKKEENMNNNEENKDMNNNEIYSLKKELSSKNELILKLQREIELNNLKNNLYENSYKPQKNINSNNSFNKYDSYKNLNDNSDLLSHKTYSINKNKNNYQNKNITLEDIQN